MSTEKESNGLESLPMLLEQLEPELKQLLARFRIPAQAAEVMLEDCLMVLVYRQDQIANPARWLQRTLRYRCVRHWRQHQQRVCRALDSELRRWLLDEAVSTSERSGRQRLLEREIGRLPGPCQPVLRSRLGLDLEPIWAPRADGDQPFDRSQRDPYRRCLLRLMRQLLDNTDAEIDGLKLLSAGPG